MEQIGVGFIGAGDVARIHKAALLKTPGAKLGAVYDVDQAKSRELAADVGAQICGTADELASLPDVDVVYALTRQEAHHANVLLALEAGKHTFVEKPVSFRREEILEWIRLSQEKYCLCVPGHNYIHSADLRLAKEMISSGRLGTVQSLWILFMVKLPPSIRCKVPEPLREVMSHHFYSLLYLPGRPESVFATNSDSVSGNTVQADQAVVICTTRGALATLFASFSADDLTCGPWTVKYKVIGSQGSTSSTWS